MSDTARPYMANSYFGAMRTPRTSKAGPHSEGKKPYHAGDYLEMELYDITDVPPYVDSPLTEPPSTPPPGEPPTPGGEEDPCAKGFTVISRPGEPIRTERVYWVVVNPSSISGCPGIVSESIEILISPDFKCPRIFQLFCKKTPKISFNGVDICNTGANCDDELFGNGFALYTTAATDRGEEVKKTGGNITIDYSDCGNDGDPWLTFAVAEDCPCPDDSPLPIYSAFTINLDQCDPCAVCPLTVTGGPTGGRAIMGQSYVYTLSGGIGGITWTTNNLGTTLTNQIGNDITLNVLSTACDYNNGAITLTAEIDRGSACNSKICSASKSAQAGTWVETQTDNWNQAAPYDAYHLCSGCQQSGTCYVETSDMTRTRYVFSMCLPPFTRCPYIPYDSCTTGGSLCERDPASPTGISCLPNQDCSPNGYCYNQVIFTRGLQEWKCP